MNNDAKTAIVLLLKGIFYKSDNEKAFFEMVHNSYAAIVEYLDTIGLELLIDENDGYAYLKNKTLPLEYSFLAFSLAAFPAFNLFSGL